MSALAGQLLTKWSQQSRLWRGSRVNQSVHDSGRSELNRQSRLRGSLRVGDETPIPTIAACCSQVSVCVLYESLALCSSVIRESITLSGVQKHRAHHTSHNVWEGSCKAIH